MLFDQSNNCLHDSVLLNRLADGSVKKKLKYIFSVSFLTVACGNYQLFNICHFHEESITMEDDLSLGILSGHISIFISFPPFLP